MDLGTAFAQLYWPAVVTAAVATFVIGGLWYSPALFVRPWMADNRLTDEDLKRGVGLAFGGAFFAALVQALVLGLFVGPAPGAATGALAGALVGFGWVLPSLATTFLFERRPGRLIAIDGAYHGVSFTVMGLILGAWGG